MPTGLRLTTPLLAAIGYQPGASCAPVTDASEICSFIMMPSHSRDFAEVSRGQ